jgi:hypothetical protein
MIVCARDLWPVLAVTLALAGCTKDKPSDTSATQPERAADILTLGAAKIMRAGHEDRAIEITPNGTVTLAGTPFGTISSDGRLTSPEGDLMMTVEPDGSVVTSGGPTGIVLDEAGGSLTLPKLSVRIHFGQDGTIETETSGPNAVLLGTDPPALHSEGCTGPVTKTCALITLSYLMGLGNPDSVQTDQAP